MGAPRRRGSAGSARDSGARYGDTPPNKGNRRRSVDRKSSGGRRAGGASSLTEVSRARTDKDAADRGPGPCLGRGSRRGDNAGQGIKRCETRRGHQARQTRRRLAHRSRASADGDGSRREDFTHGSGGQIREFGAARGDSHQREAGPELGLTRWSGVHTAVVTGDDPIGVMAGAGGGEARGDAAEGRLARSGWNVDDIGCVRGQRGLQLRVPMAWLAETGAAYGAKLKPNGGGIAIVHPLRAARGPA